MTKTLLLMRHGKSSWKDKSLPDIKRPLKKRGEVASEMIGKVLKSKRPLPDVILTSPAKRARLSAEIVAKEADISNRVTVVDSLYMAEPTEFFKVLNALKDSPERVMIVGHNPGLEALLQLLDGHVESLPTGSMAYLRLKIDEWKDLNPESIGDMIGFWNPEDYLDEEKSKKQPS